MKKSWLKMAGAAAAITLLAGCRRDTTVPVEEQEAAIEQEFSAGGQEEHFLSSEEDGGVPVVISQFAEEEAYPKLAGFLISYYGVSADAQSETRYYYNYVDLNEDGVNEIFAVVIGEETEVSFGDPAVILSEEEDGTFKVLESFAGIHTPVTISGQMTNGWHDIIYQEYGIGAEDGYKICRYNPKGGYQTELSEVLKKPDPVSGIQILSNNLIDDLDQGRYLTLAP